MSTATLCDRAGVDLEDNETFERMPRRDMRPMPVHRSGPACRAASRATATRSRRNVRRSSVRRRRQLA